MNLAPALSVVHGDVVAFVGAGGKTHSMFRLAQELAAQNWRVITTTTMYASQDELRFAPQRVGFGHGMRLPDSLPQQLDQYRHIFVFTKIERDNKVRGVRTKWLDDNLAHAPYLDVLLVEADGSRRLPMKAPKPDEPSIPSSASLVVPVIGIDALGKPLSEEHIYGADIVHTTTGYKRGEPVTPHLIASVLINPKLSLKNTPNGARIIPVINKVESEHLPSAREIARLALTDHNIERVLIAAIKNETDPVHEVHRRIGAVVLAAGESRRMGQPKMLLPWNGKTIIRTVVEKVIEAQPYEVVVVAGRMKPEIAAELADLPVRVVYNPDFEETDMITSLQTGLRAIWYTSDAAMVVLGDQPTIDPAVIRRVMESYSRGQGRIIVPSFDGRNGHPLLVDRSLWHQFMTLPHTTQPREMLNNNQGEIFNVQVDTPTITHDIDTPEDYRRALEGNR